MFLFKFELFNKSTKSPKAKEANRQVKEVSDVGVGIVVVNVDDGVDPAAVADVGRPFFHVDLQNQNDNNFTRLKKKKLKDATLTQKRYTQLFSYTQPSYSTKKTF